MIISWVVAERVMFGRGRGIGIVEAAVIAGGKNSHLPYTTPLMMCSPREFIVSLEFQKT